jgi:hypothetical protein
VLRAEVELVPSPDVGEAEQYRRVQYRQDAGGGDEDRTYS